MQIVTFTAADPKMLYSPALFGQNSLQSCRSRGTGALCVEMGFYADISWESMPERIYNPITAMGFSAMFTFQLDNTKR